MAFASDRRIALLEFVKGVRDTKLLGIATCEWNGYTNPLHCNKFTDSVDRKLIYFLKAEVTSLYVIEVAKFVQNSL